MNEVDCKNAALSQLAKVLTLEELHYYVKNTSYWRSLVRARRSELIDRAFTWSGTPQGHAYWSHISERWENYVYETADSSDTVEALYLRTVDPVQL